MYNGKLYKIKPLDITIMVDFEIILNNKYLKNEILIMFLLTPWISHESPKAYFQWGPFGMETVKILAQLENLALSEIS